jgi:hypothetical protein
VDNGGMGLVEILVIVVLAAMAIMAVGIFL